MQFRPGAQHLRMCLGIVVTVSTAVACAPAPDQARFTVEYYRQHVEVRTKTLADCVNDPGTLADHPDCVNAREAARIEGIGSIRDLPPLGLPTNPPPAKDR